MLKVLKGNKKFRLRSQTFLTRSVYDKLDCLNLLYMITSVPPSNLVATPPAAEANDTFY